MHELLGLQNQEFDFEMKFLDIVDNKRKEFIDNRLGELKAMINVIEKE